MKYKIIAFMKLNEVEFQASLKKAYGTSLVLAGKVVDGKIETNYDSLINGDVKIELIAMLKQNDLL